MADSITLLVDANHAAAERTFQRVLECIGQAQTSIHIHMFVWRSDETGNRIVDALLVAAGRGVKIHITKDADALLYECIEMNRKPMFSLRQGLASRLSRKLIALTFPYTYVEDAFSCFAGELLIRHSNVSFQWVHHTHTKYYVFDDEIMITGSINIEDRHRQYLDFMAEIQGRDLVRRFRQRQDSAVTLDRLRTVDFILNKPGVPAGFEIKPFILEQIAKTRHSLYIEMAYIGDPDISAAIIQASNRGVDVKMLFSRAANIGNDINYKSVYHIALKSRVKVFFAHKMIHSKLMMFDDETVVFGSANISVYSMQKGAELDLVINGQPDFLQAIRKEISYRLSAAEAVSDIQQLGKYNPLLAALQQLHQKLA